MTFFRLWLTERPPSSWSCVLGTVLVQVTAAREKKVLDWGLLSCPVCLSCRGRTQDYAHNAICKVKLGSLEFRLLHKQITGAGWEQTWGFLFFSCPLVGRFRDGGGFAVEKQLQSFSGYSCSGM